MWRNNWFGGALTALTLVAVGGCSSSNKSGADDGAGGATPNPIVGSAGQAMIASGSGGMIGGTGGTRTFMPAGSGTAGTIAKAGAGGGTTTAGMGGSAAMAGAGGTSKAGAGGAAGGAGTTTSTGTCGPMAFACRGPDPTMATAIGTAMGPYATGNLTDGFRDGPDYADATLYYPMGDAAPPFGCVSVVPGFISPQASIQAWGPFLASFGIVTITIGTNSPADDPPTRAAALMDALMTCTAENDRMGSPLMGKIDKTRVGVSGWSMGGGGTLIAASMNPTLKAAVSFAAWGPTGGSMNQVPVLMFEGTVDPLAAGMSVGFYTDTPDTVPKMLFEVNGAGHDVANDPSNSGGIIGLYGLSWFKVYLEGDTRYKQFLTAAKPDITATFETNVK